MATQIVIPSVGESVASGVIASWSKKVGEYVERDETVLELETDKITMEIPAPASGVLTRHGFAAGDEVAVGAVVGEIDESASKPANGVAMPAPAPAPAPAQAPAPVTASAPVLPMASTSPQGGQQAGSAAGDHSAHGDEVRATPLARKLAEQAGLSLRGLIGTGSGGKVREQDVLAAIQSGGAHDPHPQAPAPASAPAPAPVPARADRAVTRERMSPLRQRIASRLVEAQQTAAMLTTFNEVDMGAVMELRKKHKDAFAERHGVGLGFMSFFVSACCSALRAFPLINSQIVAGEDGKPAIQSHPYCDIAIAVSSPKGLVVPVLRDAQKLGFAQIESAIKDFAVRAKGGGLTLEEMQGGTFTITNGGVFGSLMSTPILNPPQSAILGMHTIKNRPAEDPAKPGQIALRPMMYLALSYDHRIVDGAEAVQFLVHIKNAIEDPARLLLAL